MKRGTVTLQNETITLRRYSLDDAPIIHEKLGCDPDMTAHSGWNPYQSLKSTEFCLDEIIKEYDRENGDYSWIIEANGTPVGTIAAFRYNKADNSLNIGYSIFREHWGNGYASEALSLACQYLLDEEGIACLKAWSGVDNIGSNKVLLRAGFVEAEASEEDRSTGINKDDKIYFEKVNPNAEATEPKDPFWDDWEL